jgi:hypothetical protein
MRLLNLCSFRSRFNRELKTKGSQKVIDRGEVRDFRERATSLPSTSHISECQKKAINSIVLKGRFEVESSKIGVTEFVIKSLVEIF